MKSIKFIFITLATIMLMLSHSQAQNAFYKTLDDYMNDKPMTGDEPLNQSWSMVMGKEFISVIRNKKRKKLNVKNLPAELFTMEGALYRTSKGKLYLVLVAGPISYYAKKTENVRQSYSETITGDMNKFKASWLEDELEKFGLLEMYNKEKPIKEKGETSNTWFNKSVARNVKYINLLNEKLKK